MFNYHPISSFLARKLVHLPFIRSEEQARNLVRIVLFYMAAQLVFMIVVYELIWFTEFGAVTYQETLWAWGFWIVYWGLFSLVAFVQGASYLGIYRYPFHRLYRHWFVAPSVIILYFIAVALAALVNSADVDAAHMMLPLVALAGLVQIFILSLAAFFALTATVLASIFYPDFAPISAAYMYLQQLVLMVMTRSFASEKFDKEALMRRNDELGATQALLSEASRQNERLRIARNIHDLVGHHVTALSINLETLAHRVDGEVLEEVKAVQKIAKELLSKVRLAVNEYRMDVALPVGSILSELTSHAPSLNIELDLQEDLVIRDAAIAEVVLRTAQETVTNTLKHSAATSLFIQLHYKNGYLHMTAIDDGQGCKKINMGNGLKGMKERVEELQGLFTVDDEHEGGFKIILKIPMSGGEL